MAVAETPFTVPLLLAASVSLVLTAYALGRRERLERRQAWSFVAVSLAAFVWSTTYWYQLTETALAGKLFWIRFVWVGVGLMTVAWPVFVFAYTGRRRWTGPRTIAALAVPPAVTVLAVWSGQYRALVFTPVALHTVASGVVLEIDAGPLLVPFLLYTYALNLTSVVLLAHAAHARSGVRKREAALLCVAAAIPLVASVATVTGVFPVANVDATPAAFGAAVPLVAFVLFRYRPLDLVPVARAQLLEEMNDGVVVLDTDGRVVDVNTTARSLVATDADGHHPVGRPAEQVFAAHPTLLEHLRDGDDAGTVVVERGGERRYYDVETSTVRDADGAVRGTLLSLRDITSRRELERWYQTIVEQASTLIAVLDEEGRFRYVTPSFERTLGYEREDLVGHRATEFVHPDDFEVLDSVLAALGEEGDGWMEVRVQDADGSWHVVEGVATDLRDDPTVEGVLLSSHDVTERRRTEQRLEVLNRVLRHDVRNEMTVVQGYVSMALERVEDPTVEEWLERARRAGATLLQVSETSRYVDAELERDPEVTRRDVVPAVERAVATARRTYPDADISLDAPARADADVTRIFGFAVELLLETAAEQVDGGVRVRVDRTADGDVEVRVGADDDWLSEADERVLTRGEESPLVHAEGLGLWVVHWTVTAADGDVRVAKRGRVVVLRLRDAGEAA